MCVRDESMNENVKTFCIFTRNHTDVQNIYSIDSNTCKFASSDHKNYETIKYNKTLKHYKLLLFWSTSQLPIMMSASTYPTCNQKENTLCTALCDVSHDIVFFYCWQINNEAELAICVESTASIQLFIDLEPMKNVPQYFDLSKFFNDRRNQTRLI